MRAALYSRVSTDSQDATNQLLQLRQYCAQQGWTIVQEYVDVASGGRSDRAQLQQMLSDAGRRRFDVLVCWAIDRLSREGAFAVLTYLQRLSAAGVKFVSFSEPYISTIGPLGDGIIALLSCIAKMEKERLRQRTLSGLARARSEGRVGGRPKALSPADVEQIRNLRARGIGYAEIGRRLKVSESSVRRSGL